MRNLLVLLKLLIIGTFLCYSCEEPSTGGDENNKITGTILNLAGDPVQGATITLLNKNISTTSNASGSFEIDPSTIAHRNEDKSYKTDVIDTLVATHSNYLNKRKWIYSDSDMVEMIIWDKKFRISNEISGWTDQPEYFATFDTAQLYDLIDGGAPIYNEQGLVDGIYQFLEKDDGKNCAISFYNFGIPENSLAMFTEQSSWISSQVVIPGYDTLLAVGDEVIGGATIYVHFGQFNLEITFGGYTDIELLKNDAVLFLEVYESKIGKIYLSP